MKLEKFKYGKVFVPISSLIDITKPRLLHSKVSISFPGRLNAMALDSSQVSFNSSNKYTAGELFFSISNFLSVEVKTRNDRKINIIQGNREALIKHSIDIMRKALSINSGFDIIVYNEKELKHHGLGTSSRLITSIAVSINELYGNPIPKDVLVKYLCQNYGEEVEDDKDNLFPSQSLGGSAISGLYKGSVFLLAGENRLIAKTSLSEDYIVVLGYPTDYTPLPASELSLLEQKNMTKFKRTGLLYSKEIAYKVLHMVLPNIKERKTNLSMIGDLIFDYRFKMGSIENCSFIYPGINDIAKELAFLKKEKIVDVLSLSSVGPSFFAITHKDNVNYVKQSFYRQSMTVMVTNLYNDSYKVIYG